MHENLQIRLIRDFSSKTNEPNSPKLKGKQDLNVFYLICVFRGDRKKTK